MVSSDEYRAKLILEKLKYMKEKMKHDASLTKEKAKKYPMATAGVAVAILGVLVKATAITKTFPEPSDVIANTILFVALLMLIYDFAKGGLYD